MKTPAQPERGDRTVRAYLTSRRALEKVEHLLNGILAGFWLGVLDRSQLNQVTGLYYGQETLYTTPEWNRSGLQPWEEQMLEQYFSTCKSLLLIGAGGGREVLALVQRGFQVEGYECNPQLIEAANRLLEDEKTSHPDLLPGRVHFLAPDATPPGGPDFDGAIIGWGAYMHIEGRHKRIEFLKNLRTRLRPGAPLLLSFFHRSFTPARLRIVAGLGNSLRWILRRPPLMVGDDLDLDFVHAFTRQEIQSELELAGYRLSYYSSRTYGHAIGHVQPG